MRPLPAELREALESWLRPSVSSDGQLRACTMGAELTMLILSGALSEQDRQQAERGLEALFAASKDASSLKERTEDSGIQTEFTRKTEPEQVVRELLSEIGCLPTHEKIREWHRDNKVKFSELSTLYQNRVYDALRDRSLSIRLSPQKI